MSSEVYHLRNPFTVMDEFLKIKAVGSVTIVRGDGPYVFNARGTRFIIGFSSLRNAAIGHGREGLVTAAAEQLRALSYAAFFAGEAWNPSPDILSLAKAISSGYLLLASTLATEPIDERFNGEGISSSTAPQRAGILSARRLAWRTSRF